MQLSIIVPALLLVLGGAGAGQADVEGQGLSNAGRADADTIPVVLAFAERLHIQWARAAIIRPAGMDASDIIVVTTETTPADLEKAVRMLISSHESTELPLPQEMRAHVTPTYQEPEPSPLFDTLTASLAAVASGDRIEIPEYGDLPALLLAIPWTPSED